MKYRKLGRTNENVSVICLGTMTWGEQNTQEQAYEQMDYALSQGVNFFDTAELYPVPPSAQTYTKTEEIIGNWFSERKNRDSVFLASKVAGPGLPWIRNGANIDRENVIKALDASLKRLQTDYIDLYQLHWPNRTSYHFGKHWRFPDIAIEDSKDINALEENFVEVLQTLDELIKAGKIRYIGLSDETSFGTMKWLETSRRYNLPRIVSIQNEYSLIDRLFEPDLAEISVYEDVGLLSWGSLGGGILSGKYLNGKRPEGCRFSLSNRYDYRMTDTVEKAVKKYMQIADKYGLDVCQMSLSFVQSRPFTTSVIIGATKMDQLKTDISSVDVDLSDEVLSDLEKIRRKYPFPF